MMNRRFLISLLVPLAITSSVMATDKSTIRLHVIDSATKKPINKVAVTYDSNYMGLTADDGGFLIYSQPVGSSHTLGLYKKGYKYYFDAKLVIDQKHTGIEIQLTAQ